MLNVISGILDAGVPPVTSSYESIATLNGTGSSGIISFTSIPSTYKHLQVRYIARDTRSTSGGNTVYLTVNGDSGSNYSTHDIEANGSSIGAGAETNGTRINYGVVTSANDGANIYGVGVIDILDYADTNKYKTARWLSGFDTNGGGLLRFISGSWRSTSAINRIDINATIGNWTSSSSFALYGIKG